MLKYETLLARYLDSLGALEDLRELDYKVLSVTTVLSYLELAVGKAFEASELLIEFNKRLEALNKVMYGGMHGRHKGMHLRRAILHDECEDAISRADTLHAIYDIDREAKRNTPLGNSLKGTTKKRHGGSLLSLSQRLASDYPIAILFITIKK